MCNIQPVYKMFSYQLSSNEITIFINYRPACAFNTKLPSTR